MRGIYQMIVVSTLLLGGCSTSTLSPEEIEYRQGLDKENLALCLKVIKDANMYWVSDHTHRIHQRHRPWEVRTDLSMNRCAEILGPYYARP